VNLLRGRWAQPCRDPRAEGHVCCNASFFAGKVLAKVGCQPWVELGGSRTACRVPLGELLLVLPSATESFSALWHAPGPVQVLAVISIHAS